jgi:hypothetical protein
MAYIGNGPGVASQRIVSTLTATDGQTSFTPTSGYTVGYVDVYLNGVKLISGTDFTASNGTNVVLTSGASVGDTLEVVAYLPRGLSDGYTKAEADARYMDINAVTLPDQTGHSGQFLQSDGTTADWATVTIPTVPDEVIVSSTTPSSPPEGQLWFDTSSGSLNAYDGTAWITYAKEGVVTDSLLLHLDPTDYTSGSSTWTDSVGGMVFTITSPSTTSRTGRQITDSDGAFSALGAHSSEFVFGTSDFSIEMWVRIDSTNYSTWKYLGGKSTFWGPGSYGLYINSAGTSLGFHTDSTNGIEYSLSSIGTGWKHIVVTRDSSGRKMYINGSQVAADSTVNNITEASAKVSFGRSDSGYEFEDSWGSYRIYGKALLASEVAKNYNTESVYY